MSSRSPTPLITEPTAEPIYTVSQLTALARELLEGSFRQICLVGEISNLARPASGHFYFTLKDQKAQVRCAFFKGAARTLAVTPENGQQVLIHANVSLYEARGEFQLIVTKLELAGEGALQLAFEKLKRKLAELGLFDPRHKKPIPAYVETIGIITSHTGAALRDILHVLKRRCPSMRVIIYPTLVQGHKAKEDIVTAIEKANTRKECDAIILARGGGSLEDLWPFNEEIVAHAIFASELPIITGIGHETDFTIADFVASFRAPTPSAAAELISPDLKSWVMQLQHLFHRLSRHQHTQLVHGKHQLTALSKRLRHPRSEFKEVAQNLSAFTKQFALLITQHLAHSKGLLQQASTALAQQSPAFNLAKYTDQLKALTQHLMICAQHGLAGKQADCLRLTTQLEQLNPLQTLKRGYAIATQADSTALIRTSSDVHLGQEIKITLSNGQIFAKVERICKD